MNTLSSRTARPKLSVVDGSSYNQMDDAELVVLCQKHQQGAFQALLKRHQRNICAMLYKLAPDWNDRADLCQEVFIRIWRGIDKLHNPQALKSWIAQITSNVFYDELRKQPRDITVLSLDAPIDCEEELTASRDVADVSKGPDELLYRKDLRQSIDEAISTLPRPFRTAIVLRVIQDLPYEQIAEITGTDLGTIKSRISRAKTKVQQILRQEYRPHQAA